MKAFYLACAATLLLLSSVATKAASLEQAVPEDSFVVFKVRNVSKLMKNESDNPLLTYLKGINWERLFKAMNAEVALDGEPADERPVLEQLADELDVSTEELKELFVGEIIFAFIGFQGEAGSTTPMIAGLADFSGDQETLEKMIYASAEHDSEAEGVKHVIEDEEFLDGTLYVETMEWEGEEPTVVGAYAFIDGVLAMSDSAEPLKRILETYSENQGTLLDNNAYMSIKDRTEDPDVALFVNLRPLVTAVVAEISFSMQGAQPNPMMNQQAILDALALDVLENAYVTADFQGEAADFWAGLNFTERRGLVSLLAYTEEEFDPPAFVPENALTSTVSNFDLGAAVTNLEEIVKQAVPPAYGMYLMQLNELNARTGIDLKLDLLESIGDVLVTYSAKGEGVDFPGDVYAIKLENAERISRAINALLDMMLGEAELFDTKDYLGTQIHSLKQEMVGPVDPQASPMGFSYAITDDWLVLSVGPGTLMETAISNMKDPDGDHFWNQDRVLDLLERLPEGASEASHLHLGELINAYITDMEMMLFGMGVDTDILFPDGDIPEEIDVPFELISKTYVEEDSFTARSIIVEAEE